VSFLLSPTEVLPSARRTLASSSFLQEKKLLSEEGPEIKQQLSGELSTKENRKEPPEGP